MSRFDRIAGRLPWTRIAEAIEGERKAVKTLSRRLDAIEHIEDLPDRIDAVLKRFDAVEHTQRGTTHAIQRLDKRLRQSTNRMHLAPPEFDALVNAVRADQRTLLGPDRLYVLWQAARNTVALELPTVELGVFRGGSARFLAAALRHFAGEEREVHAVDTFEGHSEQDVSPSEPGHETGRFGEASFADVREYLQTFSRLRLHRARFPDGNESYLPPRVGLVHLDVDLYKPTSVALELLADRMAPGGTIVVDDFGAVKTPGILRAVEEFLARGRGFQIWDQGTEQAVLVKL